MSNLTLKRVNGEFANRGEQIEAAVAWVYDNISGHYASSINQIMDAAIRSFRDGNCKGYYPEVIRAALKEYNDKARIDYNLPPYTFD